MSFKQDQDPVKQNEELTDRRKRKRKRNNWSIDKSQSDYERSSHAQRVLNQNIERDMKAQRCNKTREQVRNDQLNVANDHPVGNRILEHDGNGII